jgi:hypothetical protein
VCVRVCTVLYFSYVVDSDADPWGGQQSPPSHHQLLFHRSSLLASNCSAQHSGSLGACGVPDMARVGQRHLDTVLRSHAQAAQTGLFSLECKSGASWVVGRGLRVSRWVTDGLSVCWVTGRSCCMSGRVVSPTDLYCGWLFEASVAPASRHQRRLWWSAASRRRVHSQLTKLGSRLLGSRSSCHPRCAQDPLRASNSLAPGTQATMLSFFHF